MRGPILFFVAAFASVAACYSGGTSPGSPDASTPAGGVTYYKDVAPIVQSVCQNCHVPGGIAPFALETYDDAKANAASMVADTQARIMPPFGAQNTSECTTRTKFKGDWSLTDAQIATIKAWHDGGDLAGDPNDAPPPNTTPPITDLPNATSVAPATPYSIPANSTNDVFRCFVLDPQIATTQYLTGTFVKPGNKTIVHHALIFSVPAGATIPPPDDPKVPDQYTCFGSANVTGQQLVALWAPGAQPYVYPDGVAHPIDPGTKFVMQIHYHPHANADFSPDTTTFQFTTTTQAPTWTVQTLLVGNFTSGVDANGNGLENPPFLIAPDAKNQIFTMDFTDPKKIPIPVHLLSLAAHMHLVGTDEKITIHRDAPTATNPADECLLQVPQWNFNWQRSYEYDTDIASLPLISPGDSLKMRCTYDNTTDNPALMAALTEAGQKQTQPVTIGETTMDEMCLGAFWIVYPTL
ncbi:MAG TPA: hypothetical protein VGH28_33310 [Polyangiaceae bacterium]|jgi:hypothetical protein